MKIIRTPLRLGYIGYVLARYRIDELVLHSAWLYPFRFLSYFNPWHYFAARKLTPGQRLYFALEKLGPIFIKFGQLLSTRRDLLPDEMADALSNLQDQVKPFPRAVARTIVEESLGGPIHQFFQYFSEEAIASASIAQVHGAKLPSGEEVVVKVLRPNIKALIDRDLALLRILARLAHHFLPNSNRLRLKEIVEEFEISLNAELNLPREASNASLLRRNFKNSEKLYIPEVYWNYCKGRIIVMERIYGIPINDMATLKASEEDFRLLAERIIEILFIQIFEHNFFHADMHPGNLFISNSVKNKYIAVDFGIMGSLSKTDQRYIAENLLAFLKRDYQRVALLHVESGWVDKSVRLDDFEAAIRTVSEPVFERPLKDISMGRVVLNLVRLARDYNFTIQPQLILLQKALFHAESIARQLYPELDLWKTAKPYLERWLRQQVSLRTLFRNIRIALPGWIEKLPEMPELIYETLQAIREKQATKPPCKEK